MTMPPIPSLEGTPALEIVGAEERDGVLVRDVLVDGSIEAYLVEPTVIDARTSSPGLVFAHWFDTHAPNGNRTEFVDEAVAWVRAHGGSAVLPQLTFPWAGDPTGSSADRERIVGDVALLRRCVDLVAGRPGVDAARIGVVGHDFGGMHAIVLGTADRRPAAYVLIAAVPRWADWFCRSGTSPRTGSTTSGRCGRSTRSSTSGGWRRLESCSSSAAATSSSRR